MYVYLGSAQGLSSNSVGVIDRSSLNSQLERLLAGAGDLNQDGLDDFILLSIHEGEDEATLFHQAYPVLSFETPQPTTLSVDESDDLESADSGEVVLSGGPWQSLFSSTLTIIDLNTDGIDDILIGEFPFPERALDVPIRQWEIADSVVFTVGFDCPRDRSVSRTICV